MASIQWNPIITRPLTEDEKKDFMHVLIDADDAFMYDCKMPEDGETVLITTKDGVVSTDTYYKDLEGCSFENFENDAVIAWAHFPKPYMMDMFDDDSEGGLIDEDA